MGCKRKCQVPASEETTGSCFFVSSVLLPGMLVLSSWALGHGTQPREGQQCLSLVLVGLLPPSYHTYPVPTFRLHM